MIRNLKERFYNASLAVKIRISYLLLCVPLLVMLVLCMVSMQYSTSQYNEMLNSASMAGDFSLDFKKDFDYETYLLIVGNKSIEESELDNLLTDANRVADGLEDMGTQSENGNRIKRVKKYLVNLEKYKNRIEKNLSEEDKYEANMEIWENDVQIVTSLIREEIFNYIFYEIRDMQDARERMEVFYRQVIIGSIVGFGILTLMLVLFSIYLPNSISKPITELVEVTKRVGKGELDARSQMLGGGEVGELAESMNQMIERINNLLGQITKEQIRIREAELELLQSQINPHFLYNTLDTIVWLAEGNKQKEVVEMVKSLSSFFRTSISRGKEVITIKEELTHARSYLEIQQFRYQDILSYSIEVSEEFMDYLIPKITIQPLIENALYHGIKNKRGGGAIRITAQRQETGFAILVSDDGIGMTEDRLHQVSEGISTKNPSDKKIYGLYNVNERIRLKFGDEYGLCLDSVYGQGTVSKILLPDLTEEKNQLLEEKNQPL